MPGRRETGGDGIHGGAVGEVEDEQVVEGRRGARAAVHVGGQLEVHPSISGDVIVTTAT